VRGDPRRVRPPAAPRPPPGPAEPRREAADQGGLPRVVRRGPRRGAAEGPPSGRLRPGGRGKRRRGRGVSAVAGLRRSSSSLVSFSSSRSSARCSICGRWSRRSGTRSWRGRRWRAEPPWPATAPSLRSSRAGSRTSSSSPSRPTWPGSGGTWTRTWSPSRRSLTRGYMVLAAFSHSSSVDQSAAMVSAN
jgi:hypothetical protein